MRPAAAAPWAAARAARGEQRLLGVAIAVSELADPAHELVVTFGLGLGRHVPTSKRVLRLRTVWQVNVLSKITMRLLSTIVYKHIC